MHRFLINDTAKHIGEKLTVAGWVNVKRAHGKIVFIDLRDRSGVLQCVFIPSNKEAYEKAQEIKPEWVIELVGQVVKRPDSMVNKNIATGEVELSVEGVNVLSKAETLPFAIETDGREINEEIRMKYRYLDLRRERLKQNLIVRHKVTNFVRNFFTQEGFVEIETPMLTKSTPEGSRDFVVPSRLQPGKFFALPQSPQQYKQLLMVAGFERYFQIARALRDEDPRADRGFEHTQIDIEMSFVDRDQVMQMVEDMMIHAVQTLGFTIKQVPFPRISYQEAMERYGADKFDLRTDEEKEKRILAYAWVVDFPFFEKTENGGWTFTHNPFSNPLPEFRDDLLNGRNVENILTSQYDLVCNGYESGGGSIRAHEAEVLRATYGVMGYSDEETEASVGHILEAFKYGAPPHGGIGLGVERNIMNLTGESYLREVVAFPMTGSGNTSVMHAPGPLPKAVTDELGLEVKPNQ